MRADWARRRAVLQAEFERLDADLITLQQTILTSEQDQVREVLGDGYHLVHQTEREVDGQGITTASRWPVGRSFEVDQHISDRTYSFAASSLVTEIIAPVPFGRIWLVNHLPDWQLDHEYERFQQAVTAARALEALVTELPGHVIVAGDFDAPPDSDSVRFWTGKHTDAGLSVCYRDAWSATHQGDLSLDGDTFVPDNPYSADWDWPFRRIDYLLVRCGDHGGPTLAIRSCRRIFDQPGTVVSDHYGLVAELELPIPTQSA